MTHLSFPLTGQRARIRMTQGDLTEARHAVEAALSMASGAWAGIWLGPRAQGPVERTTGVPLRLLGSASDPLLPLIHTFHTFRSCCSPTSLRPSGPMPTC